MFRHGLYGITDTALMPDDEALFRLTEDALKGGMSILQYRDKGVGHNKLYQARKLKILCDRYSAVFIVNDNIQLAAKVGAHGVHLGEADGSLRTARRLLGDQAIIGASCYNSLDRARTAIDQGADYIAFGSVFASSVKPDLTRAEPGTLSAAITQLNVPVVAIGGITLDNVDDLLQLGVSTVAVITGLFAARDVRERAGLFVQKLASGN